MDYNETVVIPSSSGLNLPFNVFTPDIETNSTNTFEVNNTRKDLVEEIILRSLVLHLKSPSNSNFKFLKNISIYLSTKDLPEVKIAWKENIPDNIGKTLTLNTTSADLKEYIKASSIKLRVNTVTDEFIASDHTIDVKALFDVDAKILGV